MFAVLVALVAAPDAIAQSCVCASRDVALPTGVTNRAGSITVGIDYAVRQNGGESSWHGLTTPDPGSGHDHAAMKMGGHRVETATLDARVGLPAGFSLRVALPYTHMAHLGSGMAAMNTQAIADATVTGRWGWHANDRKTSLGIAAGLTLPTGKTTGDSTMRTGKGALGGTSSVEVMRKVSPLVGLGGVFAYDPSLATPKGGYRVGSSANAGLGSRVALRENGRLLLNTYGVLVYRRSDMWDGYRYRETGITALDLSVGADWTFWEQKRRSATLVTRAEAPVVQVVGDSPLAQNWGLDIGVLATLF